MFDEMQLAVGGFDDIRAVVPMTACSVTTGGTYNCVHIQ
jgi:hypothetical protein